jgi:hypothetical protein
VEMRAMSEPIRAGEEYGRLRVIADRGSRQVECRCACGAAKTVRRWCLKAGRMTSCGGYQKEVARQRLSG